jgi:hypothetical protein
MFEGARAICLGTRFRHDDIHATTFNEQNNWTQIVLSAIQNDLFEYLFHPNSDTTSHLWTSMNFVSL